MNLELNKRVAELLGWNDVFKREVAGVPGVIVLSGTSPSGLKFATVPNYSGDLNAMHEAVVSLADEKQAKFRRHLADVIQPGSGFSKMGHATVMSKETYSKWFNATASQRCEAYIRTMEETP